MKKMLLSCIAILAIANAEENYLRDVVASGLACQPGSGYTHHFCWTGRAIYDLNQMVQNGASKSKIKIKQKEVCYHLTKLNQFELEEFSMITLDGNPDSDPILSIEDQKDMLNYCYKNHIQ